MAVRGTHKKKKLEAQRLVSNQPAKVTQERISAVPHLHNRGCFEVQRSAETRDRGSFQFLIVRFMAPAFEEESPEEKAPGLPHPLSIV